ncbi:MAG: carbon-nitrogen hydrolase family protein [Deltaproteobacteria bacterium]|jgi:predicted amidohydrolase|nr:carbon-nitrogen hydrolase family protein [Deltaproteobacteria bacterium]
MSDKFLKVATVHMDVEYANPKKNLDLLVWLCRSAAALGAKLICAPEMCLTGYVFSSPGAIGPMAETVDGEALDVLKRVAAECQVFLSFGLAEKDPRTGMLYNSSLAISPNGQTVCHYRKINAESLWASPGAAVQDNVFLTPWGAMGVLICSDAYNALLPRVTALKGASLILLPTNWPLVEGGFPLSLFRLRAMENGAWILVANRGGQEEEIDFSKSRSFMVDPSGQVSRGTSSGVDHRVRAYDLPLDDEGLIEDRRQGAFASRLPDQYHRVYGDMSRIKNLTGFLGLPKPGYLDVHALAPGRAHPLDFLERVLDVFSPGSLVLLPQADYGDENVRQINRLAKKAQVGVFAAKNGSGPGRFIAGKQIGGPIKSNFSAWPVYDFGAARLMMADLGSLWHPELAVSAAKDGVDLILCPAPELTKEDALMLTLRPIEQLAVAASSPNSALVSLIPQGHGPGRGATALSGQVATYAVDTRLTREKSFQDRVDFETLFLDPILDSAWRREHP